MSIICKLHLVLLIIYCTVAYSSNLPQTSTNSNVNKGYIGFTFKKKYGDTYDTATSHINADATLRKRDSGFELVEIINEQSFYSVQLNIGSPFQQVEVLVDTGSSDLWITGSDNPYCLGTRNSQILPSDQIDCSQYGTFNKSQSSTWSQNITALPFFISYGDTTFASGVWGQDQLHLEDINVTGLSFAVANRTNSTVGVLGVGLPSLEVTNAARNGYQYDNFPMILKRSGATSSSAYSLFLNSLDEEHGSILFGAVDNSKYTGSLYTIPLINTLQSYGYNQPIQFEVTLQGIGLSGDDNDSNVTLTTTKIPVLLDSGTTLTYLPKPILDNLADNINATFSERYGYYVVPCNFDGNSSSNFNDNSQLVFDFGGFHIDTPLKDYLISISRNTCILGLIPQDSNSGVLGDTFLSHAYVVYDLERLEISMAQTKFINNYNADDTKGTEINTIDGNNSVPGATKAAGYSNTWSTTVSTVGSSGNIFTLQPHATGVNSQVSVTGSAVTTIIGTTTSMTTAGSSTVVGSTSTSTQTTMNLATKHSTDYSDILGMVFLSVIYSFNLF